MRLALPTTQDARAIAEAVRRTFSDEFPQASRLSWRPAARCCPAIRRQRLGAWFFSGFGIVALLLGIGAIFAIVLDLTEARRREMAIRMVLGDSPAHVMKLLVAASLRPVVLGLAIGLFTSSLLSRWVESLLVGVGHLDWVTYQP